MADNKLVTGSRLHFATALPTAYTQAAFEAITTWKEVLNVASFPADMRTRNNVEKETVAHGTITAAGTIKAPELSFEFVGQIDPLSDAEVLLAAAMAANTKLSYWLEFSDGSSSYGECQLTEYGHKGGAPNEMTMKSGKFTRSTKTTVDVAAT